MADLGTIANIAEIAGASLVLVALVFAAVEIRLAQRRRREEATIELVHNMLDPEFKASFQVVNDLPEGLTMEEIRDTTGAEEALTSVAFIAESMGVMVHNRVADLRTVDELIGSFFRVAWRRMHRYIEDRRGQLGHPGYMEWFQWLVERLEEHPAPSKEVGAQVYYRDWKPR